MEPGLHVLKPSPATDPGGARLKAVLAEHVRLERLRAVRRLLVQVLALVGLPLWITAAWPHLVTTTVRSLLLATWTVLAAASLWAVVAVVRARRRLTRLDTDAPRA